MSHRSRRRITSAVMVTLCAASVVLAVVPLVLVLGHVIHQGLGALGPDFFTKVPHPVGEPGGGMANAIVGTLLVVGIGSVAAIPVAVLCGIHLAEDGRSMFSSAVRFSADVLNGVPSIVVGIFAYAVAVMPFHRFSALAGGFALGVMMIPLIARTTEELLRMVPPSLREGALALGASRARAAFTVMLPAALPGIFTGILLALARVAGETAPLLFTSFNNRFLSGRPSQPVATLPVQIYTYAISPYEDWHRQAWTGALVLVSVIALLSACARLVTRRLERMHRA